MQIEQANGIQVSEAVEMTAWYVHSEETRMKNSRRKKTCQLSINTLFTMKKRSAKKHFALSTKGHYNKDRKVVKIQNRRLHT